METKNNLRHALLTKRKALAPAVRMNNDLAIGKQLIRWLDAHPTRTLAVYWPIQNEPDLRALYPEIAARGVQLALPVVVEKDHAMTFRAWSPGDPLSKDKSGVPTAAGTSREAQPDVVLVPCVGFNAGLIRLGYGAGYYDRTLALAPRPTAIGIAYAYSKVAFEGAPHDVALDAVITENAICSITGDDA
jgi:5,10-methenyltetrahydrofolate synthetase